MTYVMIFYDIQVPKTAPISFGELSGTLIATLKPNIRRTEL